MKRIDILITDFLYSIADKLEVPAKAGDQISVVIDRITLSVDDLIKENAELKYKLGKAIEALHVSVNQLRGVSFGIKTHGQNINPYFFITEYEKMACEKEKVIKELRGEG